MLYRGQSSHLRHSSSSSHLPDDSNFKMAPVVEVMFAPATEAYRDDHSTMFPVMDIVSASKGCLGYVRLPVIVSRVTYIFACSIYYGIGVEDPNLLAHIVGEHTAGPTR